jgi:hypothetical protein
LGSERGILRVVRQLRLFLGVKVIKVAEEFVEAVHRRQRFVAVANVVLAELTRGKTEIPQQPADRRVLLAHAHRRAGKADLREPGANDVLPGEKRRASRGTALLTVIVQKSQPLVGDPIDIRRLVPITPSLYALTFVVPMSSPKITRIFGFGAWARQIAAARKPCTIVKPTMTRFMVGSA